MYARNLILGVAMVAVVSGYAHDFTATVEGQKIYFDIKSKSDKTAAVTYNGSITDHIAPEYIGILEIPARVKHEDVVYTVTEIGPKAFAGASRLEGVMIPYGINSIGDFAFEGCDSLRTVVFPGNNVLLGQGVFFKCPHISSVTIGSDWTSIDLSMFRWSEELKNLTIPAKIEKIQGFKRLKGLESISVDPNNRNFSSYEGVLYNKTGRSLYACPRAYAGKLNVKDSTEKIEDGALIDCKGVTALDFPESLESVSFRETMEMGDLKSIVIRCKQPLVTGYVGNEGKFLFYFLNNKTEIFVPSDIKEGYLSILADEAGEYSVSKDGIPYLVGKKELPLPKNVKSIRTVD